MTIFERHSSKIRPLSNLETIFSHLEVNHLWNSANWFLWFLPPRIRFGHKSAGWEVESSSVTANRACFVDVLPVRLGRVPPGWRLYVTVLKFLIRFWTRGFTFILHWTAQNTWPDSIAINMQWGEVRKWAWGSTLAPLMCGGLRCVPTEGCWATEASWDGWRLGSEWRGRKVCEGLWDWELRVGTMDPTHGGQNVTLPWADGTGPHTPVVTDQRPDQRWHSQQRAPKIQWAHVDSIPSSPPRSWGPHKPRANKVTSQSVDTAQVKNGAISATDHRSCQWAISILWNHNGINILAYRTKYRETSFSSLFFKMLITVTAI